MSDEPVDLEKLKEAIKEYKDRVNKGEIKDDVEFEEKERATVSPISSHKKWNLRSYSIGIYAMDVEPVDIQWLLPGYIGEGITTIIQGPIGARKTTLLMAWANAVTQGYGYHKQDVEHAKRGVLYVTMEGGTRYEFLANQFKGDPSLLRYAGWIRTEIKEGDKFIRPLDIWEDRSFLFEEVFKTPDIGLVIIEPIASHVGDKADSTKVHRCYSVLEQIMDTCHCATVLSAHLNKDGTKAADMRASGAIELVTRSPIYLNLSKDQDDADISNLVAIRTRFSKESSLNLSFRVTEDQAIQWLEARESNAGEALRVKDKGEGKTRKWIREQLKEGDRLVKDLKEAADGTGMLWNTIAVAASRMDDLLTYTIPTGKGRPQHWWKLKI